MAQISLQNIKKIDKERNFVHEEVYSTYTVFELGGNKYFQIDTYGKTDREFPKKISQSFQLNRSTAQFLVDILRHEFDLF